MTLDQVYDELYGEIDQIKNELKNTLAQIQYASNFTEGVSLGTLSVGAESSQVIAPHVSLLPGAESGMMVLDLPVGTESAMLPVQIQDDPEATDLVDDAIPTGGTVESYLNSNISDVLMGEVIAVSGTTDAYGIISVPKTRQYGGALFVVTNVADNNTKSWYISVNSATTTTVSIRIRNMSDNSVLANTDVDFVALLFGRRYTQT